MDVEAEHALVVKREKWRDAEKIEQAALQKAVILKWQEEAKEAKKAAKATCSDKDLPLCTHSGSLETMQAV